MCSNRSRIDRQDRCACRPLHRIVEPVNVVWSLRVRWISVWVCDLILCDRQQFHSIQLSLHHYHSMSMVSMVVDTFWYLLSVGYLSEMIMIHLWSDLNSIRTVRTSIRGGHLPLSDRWFVPHNQRCWTSRWLKACQPLKRSNRWQQNQ